MTAPPSHQLLSTRHRRAILLSLVLAAGLYLGIVIAGGYAQAWSAVRQLGWQGGMVLLACSFVSYVIRYARWQFYVRQAGWQLPHGLHFLYYLAGFALTTTPGKAGETIRSVLLRPHGVPYHTSLACFFTERLLDVVVIALLASLILTAFTEQRLFVVLAILLAISVLPVLHSSYPAAIIQSLHQRLRDGPVRQALGHLQHLLHDAQALLGLKSLYLGVLLGAVAWIIQGLAFYYLLLQLGFAGGLALALGIYALSLLAGAVSMIPGGLGSTELAMGLLLGAAGAEQHVVLTVPIISRLATLWFAVLLGLAATSVLGSLRHTRPG